VVPELVIGIVRTSFGVSGEVKVESCSGEYDHIVRLDRMTLRKGTQRSERAVESVRMAGGLAIVKLSGVDTPEEARTLAGSEIIVDRDGGCSLGEDEYYYADLVGLRIVAGGKDRGVVAGLLEIGDRLMIESEITGCGTRLIPFVGRYVGAIDLDTGTVEIIDTEIIE
jgi:16S rRNA processing protein RimM